jgi:hypothetical protein
MARAEIDRGSAWLRWAAAALLAVYVAFSAWLLWRTAVLAVFSDEYDWAHAVYQLQADHRWAAYLLSPHNLNRMVWTRLAMAFDMGALGGTNAPLIVSGALGLAVVAATLSLQAARAAPAALKLPLAAVAAMLTLMPGNVLDASTPIYATYAQAGAFAVLALALSEGAVGSPLGWRGLAALVCAMGSAFGSAAGLALWPVMAWGALRRRDWLWLGVVLAVGGIFVGLYFAGQGHGAGAAALPALHDPKDAAILALSYLTLPWTRLVLHQAWILGALVGTVALVLALGKGGAKAAPSQRVACGFILFALATAAMAGLGRSGAADPYNVPLRYGLLVAPLHVGLVMLWAPGLGRLWRGHRRLVEGMAAGALAALLVHDAAFGLKVITASDIIRETVVDFHAGVRTPRMLSLIYPNLDYAQAMSAQLKRDGFYQHELHLRPRANAPAKPV